MPTPEGRQVRIPGFLAALPLALLASLPALAQTQPDGHERGRDAGRHQQDFRRDGDLQRRQQDRMEGGQGQHGRLTPEERQQLRRDIREHGRDVYRDRPRRF